MKSPHSVAAIFSPTLDRAIFSTSMVRSINRQKDVVEMQQTGNSRRTTRSGNGCPDSVNCSRRR